jgi:hypothetical protein
MYACQYAALQCALLVCALVTTCLTFPMRPAPGMCPACARIGTPVLYVCALVSSLAPRSCLAYVQTLSECVPMRPASGCVLLVRAVGRVFCWYACWYVSGSYLRIHLISLLFYAASTQSVSCLCAQWGSFFNVCILGCICTCLACALPVLDCVHMRPAPGTYPACACNGAPFVHVCMNLQSAPNCSQHPDCFLLACAISAICFQLSSLCLCAQLAVFLLCMHVGVQLSTQIGSCFTHSIQLCVACAHCRVIVMN